MAKQRGPYRSHARRYEAILEGIRQKAREDRSLGYGSAMNRYTRADYRQAYKDGYIAPRIISTEATDHV